MNTRNRLLGVTLLVAVMAVPATGLAQSCQDLRDAGDTLRWALPAAALGLTALNKDVAP